jgi:hypothetical protein
MAAKEPILIGRAETVDFTGLGCQAVPARIDTGAKTSSLWASSIAKAGAGLDVVFFGQGSPYFTGKPVHFSHFEIVAVASSTGEIESRYKVRLGIHLRGRRIRASFTLADRSVQAYPVLIGRNVLRGKFIVDVSQGTIAHGAENHRLAEMRAVGDKIRNEERA